MVQCSTRWKNPSHYVNGSSKARIRLPVVSVNLSGFAPCLNFKRDEEAIFKVLNVSSYKIDLTKPMISLNTKGTDRQSDESDHEEVSTGVNC